MTSSQGKRKLAWAALAAVILAGASSIGCAVGPGSRMVFPPAPAQCVWEGIERVVAVGDIHGDYGAFVKILRDRGLVGEGDDPSWTGGQAHLVQIGDVVDRMPDSPDPNEPIKGPRDIYILLSRLEQEAAAAGGMVHFLPGNHEEMNLAGVSMDYVGYVSIEQFKSFLHGAYRNMHDRATARMTAEDADRYWQALMSTAGARRAYYEGYRDAVGAWIVGHNVIIKINGVVFVHGGITIEDSRRSLESINAGYREEFILAMRDNARDFQFVFQPNAPLWYRGLEEGRNAGVSESDLKQILSNLKAKRIVVGHTPMTTAEAKRFGGLVYMIDSNISSSYDKLVGYSQLSCLEIDINGDVNHIRGERNGTKKSPDGGVRVPWNPGSMVLRLRPLSAAGRARAS